MTLYENTITRDSSLDKKDSIQNAYERMLLNENINEKIELELVNAELNESSWVDAAKKVVKDKQYLYVNLKNNEVSDDKKKGFVMLDMSTANMLVQIVSALGKLNKEKFTKLPLAQAIDLGWKLVSK